MIQGKHISSISPYLIFEWKQNISSMWPWSVETVTQNKYAAEYEQIWKWMVKFLSKFQGHDIKVARVNSIHVAKPFIFFNILCAIAS